MRPEPMRSRSPRPRPIRSRPRRRPGWPPQRRLRRRPISRSRSHPVVSSPASPARSVSAPRLRLARGRAAVQLEISFVSIRTCWCFDRVLWRFTYSAPARGYCVSLNPHSDRVVADVHRRPLSLRRRLRSGSGNLVRICRRALPIAANCEPPIESGNLDGGGGEIRTHEAFRPSGFQDRRDQPLCHPSREWMSNVQRPTSNVQH